MTARHSPLLAETVTFTTGEVVMILLVLLAVALVVVALVVVGFVCARRGGRGSASARTTWFVIAAIESVFAVSVLPQAVNGELGVLIPALVVAAQAAVYVQARGRVSPDEMGPADEDRP